MKVYVTREISRAVLEKARESTVPYCRDYQNRLLDGLDPWPDGLAPGHYEARMLRDRIRALGLIVVPYRGKLTLVQNVPTTPSEALADRLGAVGQPPDSEVEYVFVQP